MPQVVQKKALAVESAALCATMDLIALILSDKSVTVLRTFSWEKVFWSSSVTLCGLSTAIAFSPKGKHLVLGQDDGTIKIIDIESSYIHAAKKPLSSSGVINVFWHCTDSPESDFHSSSVYLSNGSTTEDSSIKSSLIITLDKNYTLQLFLALYPLMNITLLNLSQPNPLSTSSSNFPSNIFPSSAFPSSAFPSSAFPSSAFPSSAFPSSLSSSTILGVHKNAIYLQGTNKQLYILPSEVLSNIDTYTQISSILLSIVKDTNTLSDSLSALNRKWRDAVKPIIPKLLLMQSTLSGYSIHMTVCEFLFSITQTGLWHPAVNVIFSSQWNVQNVARLRSSIDITTRQIERTLIANISIILMNLHMKCMDLQKLLQDRLSAREIDQSARLNDLAKKNNKIDTFYQLYNLTKLLLFKLDSTLYETRLARSGILLFLRFVSDCITECTSTQESLLHIEHNIQYARLFDPRIARCQVDISANCSAEFISGSYLFAHLQEGTVPIRQRSARESDHAARKTDSLARETDSELIADLVKLVLCDEDGVSINDRSLASCVKAMQAAIEEALVVLPTSLSQPSTPIPPITPNSPSSDVAVAELISSTAITITNTHNNTIHILTSPSYIHITAKSNNISLTCFSLDTPDHIFDASMCISDSNEQILSLGLYHGIDKEISVIGTTMKNGISSLFRFCITELRYTLRNTSHTARENDTPNVPIITPIITPNVPITPNIPITWSILDVKCLSQVIICGSRGIVCIVEKDSGLLVLDVDADDEEEDEASSA